MKNTMWEYSESTEFTSIQLIEFNAMDVSEYIYNKKVLEKWKNVWVKPSQDDVESRDAILGDFIWMPSGIPVFSIKATEALKPLIGNHVEFLPLRWYPDESRELYGINVLTILDCLDENKSELSRSKSTNRILSVQKYVFKEDCIDLPPIFHIKPSLRVFVSEDFKRLIEDFDLIGIDLKEIEYS